jgi:hypothetical protein
MDCIELRVRKVEGSSPAIGIVPFFGFYSFFLLFYPVVFVVDFPSMSQLGDEVVEPGLAMPPVAMVSDAPHLGSGSAMCGCKFKSYKVVCYKHEGMPHQYLSVLFVSKACCFVTLFKR